MSEEKERGIVVTIDYKDGSTFTKVVDEDPIWNLQEIDVKFKKLSPLAVIPNYAHFNDAGLDLTAISENWNDEKQCYIYGTGLAIAIPKGFVGLIFPRSSVRDTNLIMANCIGVIDAGYRGEITISFKEHVAFGENDFCDYQTALADNLRNRDQYLTAYAVDETFCNVHTKLNKYNVGDRVAQLIIIPFPRVNVIEVEELPAGERGANGHGSSGK